MTGEGGDPGRVELCRERRSTPTSSPSPLPTTTPTTTKGEIDVPPAQPPENRSGTESDVIPTSVESLLVTKGTVSSETAAATLSDGGADRGLFRNDDAAAETKSLPPRPPASTTTATAAATPPLPPPTRRDRRGSAAEAAITRAKLFAELLAPSPEEALVEPAGEAEVGAAVAVARQQQQQELPLSLLSRMSRSCRRRQNGGIGNSSSSSSSSVLGAISFTSASSLIAGTEGEEEDESDESDESEDGDESYDDATASAAAAAAAQARAAALALSSTTSTPPEPCDTWEWLPEGLLCDILSRLDAPALRRARLACRRWRAAADAGAVVALAPRRAMVRTIVSQFPRLRALDLGGCSNVRNRSLACLASSERVRSRLRALAVGGGYAPRGAVALEAEDDGRARPRPRRQHALRGPAILRPRVSNSGVAHLGELTSLVSLALSDCSSVTDSGLEPLRSLKQLRALALCRCPRVGDRGLLFASSLTDLTSVDLYGCERVSDATLRSLARSLPRLASLSTGFTRITDAGAAALGNGSAGTGEGDCGPPSLRSVSFHAEGITDAGVAALLRAGGGGGRGCGITSLGLSNCTLVTGSGIAAALSPSWAVSGEGREGEEDGDERGDVGGSESGTVAAASSSSSLSSSYSFPSLSSLQHRACCHDQRQQQRRPRSLSLSLARLNLHNCPSFGDDELRSLLFSPSSSESTSTTTTLADTLESLQLQGTGVTASGIRMLSVCRRLSALGVDARSLEEEDPGGGGGRRGGAARRSTPSSPLRELTCLTSLQVQGRGIATAPSVSRLLGLGGLPRLRDLSLHDFGGEGDDDGLYGGQRRARRRGASASGDDADGAVVVQGVVAPSEHQHNSVAYYLARQLQQQHQQNQLVQQLPVAAPLLAPPTPPPTVRHPAAASPSPSPPVLGPFFEALAGSCPRLAAFEIAHGGMTDADAALLARTLLTPSATSSSSPPSSLRALSICSPRVTDEQLRLLGEAHPQVDVSRGKRRRALPGLSTRGG